jgi:hypothetical protein
MTAALDLLARADKWYLSAGEGLIWAPPFPTWLDAPGFWDEAHLFGYPLAPLFTVAFVDDAGRRLPLRTAERRWSPAALEVLYAPLAGLELVESRMVLPGFVLGSEWQIANVSVVPTRLHAVAWTTAPGEEVEPGEVQWNEAELAWGRVLRAGDGAILPARFQLALARGTDTWGAVRAAATADQPHFTLTPFWDRWDPTRGGLRCALELGGVSTDGLVYFGVHRSIEIGPGEAARLAVALRCVPELEETAERADTPAPRRASSFAAASRAAWEAFLDGVPSFRCSDPYFERYWTYRWYALRMLGCAGGWGHFTAPVVAEGVGPRHVATAASAPAQMRELRWAREPEWARNVLRVFVAHQRADGAFPAVIDANAIRGVASPAADWAAAVLALDAVHPSDAFLREVLPALEGYAEWLVRECDRERTGLFDVAPRADGADGCASRFVVVDPEADRPRAAGAVRLKGVDATVSAYRLFQALALLGPRGGLDGARWQARAEATGAALLRRMWDEKHGIFTDVNPATGRRTGVRTALGFVPYDTDLIGGRHLAGLVQALFDPRQFWKPFPVPSASGTDPRYDPDGAWRGKRHDDPWNGRVRPEINSMVAEAIAAVALGHLPALRAHLAEFVTKAVRMLFWDGDASRPNSFEHYHPVTGRPSAYRGLDDCLLGRVNDLIAQYVIGLRPAGDGECVVDPMPFSLDGFEARGLPMQGALVDVEREGERVVVRVNGREAARGRVGEPLGIRL